MKVLVLGTCCSNHFPRPGCSCDSCKDPIFKKRKYSALLINDIMLDCGEDWKKVPSVVKKIVVTHSHPDHAFGLKYNLDKELYMSGITYNSFKRILGGAKVQVLEFGAPVTISGLEVVLFPVLHSTIAPASCIRVQGKLLYCPDVKEIPNKGKVLRGISIYVGDGSSFKRDIQYRAGIGHKSMVGQMEWLKGKAKSVLFTHIGHVKMSHKNLNIELERTNREGGFGFSEVKALKEGDTFTF